MKTRRWILGVLILSGGIAPLSRAQTLPFSLAPGSVANASFGIDVNGTLTATGPLNSNLTFSFSGAPQMIWFPALGAFRAGAFSGTGSQTTIGQYSVAFNSGSVASGYGAFAMNGGIANNFQSVAFAGSRSSGPNAFASGFGSMASGSSSIALGESNTAVGDDSIAFGYYSTASNTSAMSTGSVTIASGMCSLSTGYVTTASGSFSISAGTNTSANSYDSVVLGQYNVGLTEKNGNPNTTTWMTPDPLFEIGNGSSSSAKSDALVIYKDGNAVFSPPPGTSSCTVAAPVFLTTTPGGSGDIPMYIGN